MSKQEDCAVKLSDISNLILTLNEYQSLNEHVRNQQDLKLLHLVFKHYFNCINNGIKHRENISLTPLLERTNTDNVDDVCKIIKAGLEIQVDRTESTKLLDHLQKRDIDLVHLKLTNALLQVHWEFTSLDLLEFYLKHLCCIEQLECNLEYKYFIANILPIFIKNNDTVLFKISEYAYLTNNLYLLASVPSENLLSESFKLILQDEKFWFLLIEQLQADAGFKYKIAIYMLKLSLEMLNNMEEFSNDFITFTSEQKQVTFKSFDYLCILTDVIREKQLHLIEPSLQMLTKINNLPLVWINLIYKQILCHAHNAVGYYGAYYLLKQQLVCDYMPLFHCLNKSDDSKLCKTIFKNFKTYCTNLDEEKYVQLISESLTIKWNPVAFYKFYKNAMVRPLGNNFIIEIIKNCKRIPHKYIRQGLIYLIFMKIRSDINESTNASMDDYLEIILELMMDDVNSKYATKLINLTNLKVDENFIMKMKTFLTEEFPSRTKIDFIIELTERKELPAAFIKSLYEDFKSRRYAPLVLDRLSYLYLVKATDLQEYLLQRLGSQDETHSIRHMDKPSYDLISKSIQILCSNASNAHQQSLSFEILFYGVNTYNNVYSHWFNKILGGYQVSTSIALQFLSLLIKIPTNFGKNHLGKLLSIYELFFSTQNDEVAVKIFRNFDFVLENINSNHIEFIKLACKRLMYLKSRDDCENAIRYLVRSIALNYKTINKNVLNVLLEELYKMTKSEGSERDFVIYYSTMYFKYLNFDYKIFPMYEFLLYPNDILNKTERAEYEICTEIYLNIHSLCPYFRPAEIRKWALEDLLFDNNSEKIIQTVQFLLATYRKNFNKRYFPDSSLHLQKFRTMQIFAFLLTSLPKEAEELLVNFLLESFTVESHQNSVRVLMQYLLVQLLKNKDDLTLIWGLLDYNTCSKKIQNSTLTSLVPVLYGLDLIRASFDFSQKVLENMLAWTMGPQFKLRFFAQKLIYELCHKHRNNFKFKKYEPLYKAVDFSLKATQITENLQLDFQIMDRINSEKPWRDYKKMMQIITIYIPEATNVCIYEWEYFKIKHAWSKYLKENIQNIDESLQELSMDDDIGDNIQKKITPWQESLETKRIDSKGGLILIATLIESAANLGGLARTCEIFGVQTLVVDCKKIVEQKEFHSLSMSSERWLEINEVKEKVLADYLKELKQQNYKIIGVEQTSDSIALGSYTFDEKTALLLGNERSGIPAPLICLMDACVEIPQFGMVRSLNVHVAGALVVWEYAKQKLVKLEPK